MDALETVSHGSDRNAIGKAAMFLDSLESPIFRLCLDIMCRVLNVTRPLSVKLQAKDQDLLHAIRSVDDCIDVLQTIRDGETFNTIVDHIESESGSELSMPRRTHKQAHRSNPPAASAREHYRRAVFLPFVDTCLNQLRERFKTHRSKGLLLCSLLLSVCEDRTFSDAEDGVKLFVSLLGVRRSGDKVPSLASALEKSP